MEYKKQKSPTNLLTTGIKNSKLKYRLESVGEGQYILNVAGKKIDIHYDASKGMYRNFYPHHIGKTLQEVVNIIVDEVANGVEF